MKKYLLLLVLGPSFSLSGSIVEDLFKWSCIRPQIVIDSEGLGVLTSRTLLVSKEFVHKKFIESLYDWRVSPIDGRIVTFLKNQ